MGFHSQVNWSIVADSITSARDLDKCEWVKIILLTLLSFLESFLESFRLRVDLILDQKYGLLLVLLNFLELNCLACCTTSCLLSIITVVVSSHI